MNVNQQYITQIINIINRQNYSDTSQNRAFLQNISNKLKQLYGLNNVSKTLELLVNLEVADKLSSRRVSNNECLFINPAFIFGFKINNNSPSTNLKMLPKV